MLSKTKLKARLGRKKNSELAEALSLAIKNKAWKKIADRLSSSTKRYSSVNLSEIDNKAATGDTVIVTGKVLGSGVITKKVRVCALGFSASAREKLNAAKSEIVHIKDEIKINPKAQGIKIIQ